MRPKTLEGLLFRFMAMLNPFPSILKSLYTDRTISYTYKNISPTYKSGTVLLSSLLLMGCGNGPTSGNTPQEMFAAVLQKPMPTSVTQLQGVGDTWQGYQLFLRFQAADADIEALIQSGYEGVDCDAIASDFRLPNQSYDSFNPPWQPQTMSTKECWIVNQVSNAWTSSGTHHLIIDRSQNLIYFTGIGI